MRDGYAKNAGWKTGDRITVAPAIGCGECWPCRNGHTNMCDHLETIGWEDDGVFAEYISIPAKAIRMGNVLKLPDDVSYDSATLTEPAGCALNGQSYMHIQPGDNVVIYGSGMIGCIHAELAFLSGAGKVMICEPVEKRGRIAEEKVPGVIWINNGQHSAVEEVMRLTDGVGANVVITATSYPPVQVEAQEIAAKMARICLFGGLPGDSKGYIDSNRIHYKELQICGVHATTPKFMREVMEMLEDGRLDSAKYIERFYSLDDIEKGKTYAHVLNYAYSKEEDEVVPIETLKILLRELPGENVSVFTLDGKNVPCRIAAEGEETALFLQHVPVYTVIKIE